LGKAYQNIFDQTDNDWSINLVFKIPIGNKSSKADYKLEELNFDYTRLQLKKKEQAIALNIKSKIREIQASIERLEAARKTLELSEENYKIELKRFELQQTTTYDLLDFQTQLEEAKINVLKAE